MNYILPTRKWSIAYRDNDWQDGKIHFSISSINGKVTGNIFPHPGTNLLNIGPNG